MIYYIADIHFNDMMIFNKCSRPFANLEEYKNEIIKRWNERVKRKDTVYVLGDIAQDFDEKAVKIFKKLNGTKHFIIGNHDLLLMDAIRNSKIFKTIDFIKVIKDNNRKVCICHYPLLDWIEFNRDGYHIYGHIHNKTRANGSAYAEIKKYYINKLAYNCSVDVIGFKPVTLDEMIKLKEDNKYGPYIN